MARQSGPIAKPWRNRIIGHGEVRAADFLANPMNWRIHPANQQSALKGSLDEIGWIEEVTVNQGTNFIVDGHLRVILALREGDDVQVPVTFVDLSEEEEGIVLATKDTITSMAGADREKLDALLHNVQPESAALQQMLSDLAAREGLIPPDDPLEHWQGMLEFVHEDKTAFQTIAIHFKDQSAINEFVELIGQTITSKTRFLWYPEQEIIRYGDAE